MSAQDSLSIEMLPLYPEYFGAEIVLTGDWQRVSASGYGVAEESILLNVQLLSPGTLWVDDVAMSYVPGALVPTPSLGLISPSFFGLHVARFGHDHLLNGGLEAPFATVGVHNKTSGQLAANWRIPVTSNGTIALSQDTNNPHSGASAQKVVVITPTAGFSQTLALTPGSTYTVSVWLRGDPGMRVFVALLGTGSPAPQYLPRTFVITSDWKQYTATGQVDESEVQLFISGSNGGTFWIDDFSLTDSSGQPPAGGAPWPAAPFGALRIWNSFGTAWGDLEPAKGQWDWEVLDNWVQSAQQHGVQKILLTLGQTPGWASSNPDIVTYLGGAGGVAPPTNLQDWRDYVTAVAQRYKGRIQYYEIWNEPNDTTYYAGTVQELVSLTQEAYKILKSVDPSNIVVAPVPYTLEYFDTLLAAGVGKYVDVLSYHKYTLALPPEGLADIFLANLRLIMAKYGVSAVPLWDTEGASADDTTPADVAPKYLARRYLTDLAYGAYGFCWFSWDEANKFTPAFVQTDHHVITSVGRAYAIVYGWLVGSTLTGATIDSAGTWQISLTRPDGTKAMVVWNPNKTTQFLLPGNFVSASSHDISGGVKSTSGSSVTVTDSPVLLTSTVDVPSVITSVNVAGGGSDLAQNTWIEIRGTNLVPANSPTNGMIWSTAPEFVSNLMPTQLGNVPLQATVNNIPAYLYFYCSAATDRACASDQINVLTPLDNTSGQVQITVWNGIYAASFTANLRPASPSFPLLSGTKYIVATHADNTLVGPAALSLPGYPITPAQPNETIVIYAFGFGLPQTALISGSATQSGTLAVIPVCQIGGTTATVSYAGVIGPGLYQLNMVVPNGVASGDNKITCTYDGMSSPFGDLVPIQ